MNKPTSVVVFGVLNIVFAGITVLTLVFSLLVFSSLLPQRNVNNPAVQLIQNSPAYSTWVKFTLVMGFAACAVKLAAGIGLLQLKPWARKLSIGYAIYAMIMVVVGAVVNYFLLMRPLLEQTQHNSGSAAVGAVVGAVGGTFGSCLGLIYPILLLIFMQRANVKAAFAGDQPVDNRQ